MSTYRFQKVSARGQRSGVCPECGKRGRRTRMFWQTVSPFNKNGDGNPKTRIQIGNEVSLQALVWAEGQFVHAGCES